MTVVFACALPGEEREASGGAGSEAEGQDGEGGEPEAEGGTVVQHTHAGERRLSMSVMPPVKRIFWCCCQAAANCQVQCCVPRRSCEGCCVTSC